MTGVASSVEVELADLARAAIARVAPEQSGYLELVIASRDAGKSRTPTWTGGAVGAGDAVSVLADVVFPLLTSTIAQVWGAAAFAGLQRRRWWRRRKPDTRVTLDLSMIDKAHGACVEHGQTLGLSSAEATLLADAVCGHLRGDELK